jgi:hypothetical protein
MADNFLFVQAQPTTLYGAGATAADTTLKLTSFVQIDGSTTLTMSNFGSKGFGTIEPNNGTQEEQISFTGITQNADGSATLTGVSTVLFISPYTETSGLAKSHPGGVTFVISNTAGFYNQLTSKEDDETINGLWTFSQFPQKSGSTTPTANAELASKAYVDSVAGGIATTNQILDTGTAGENMTIGKICYFKSSDAKWYLADSSDTTKSVAVKLGVVQATVTTGNTFNVLVAGLDANQSGLSAGSTYYLSTAGGISTTKGSNIRLIGRAKSTTQIHFEDDEQSTEVQLVDNSRIYATSTGSANAYVLTLTPAITAYKAGQIFEFKANFTCTGASTLAVSGLAATAIKINKDQALSANDIVNGQVVQVQYDGTNFQMLGSLGNPQVSQNGHEIYGADAGGTDAYAVTLSPIPTAYAAGMVVNFKANTINTGAATLNVNSLGAKSIKTRSGSDPFDGQILATSVNPVVYDGTNFQLIGDGRPSGVIKTSSTTVSTVSTTETNLMTVAIPALVLGTTNVISGDVNFSTFNMNNTVTGTLRLKYGSTTIATGVFTNSSGSAIVTTGMLRFNLIANAATNAQTAFFLASIGDGTIQDIGATTDQQNASLSANGTASEDSTTALNLRLSAQVSGTGTITLGNYVVRAN